MTDDQLSAKTLLLGIIISAIIWIIGIIVVIVPLVKAL